MRHEHAAGRPYYKAAAHMPWFDRLPLAWRRLVDEYNSVNGVKHAMRKGISPEQARVNFEAQRVKHQYDPIPDKAAKAKKAMRDQARNKRGRRIMNSLNEWLDSREPA